MGMSEFGISTLLPKSALVREASFRLTRQSTTHQFSWDTALAWRGDDPP
jgi:hypothetical protein